MENISDTEENEKLILSIFEKMPDKDLLGECINESQVEFLLFLKAHFLIIGKCLSNYFSGRQMISADMESYPDFPRGEIERQVDKWICLYDLIQRGWDYIVEESKVKGVSIDDSPGKLFESIIRNHVEGLFAIHKCNCYEFSPSKSHKQLRLIFNAEVLLDQVNRGDPLMNELMEVIKEIEKLNQKGENIGAEFEYLYLLCLSAFNRNRDKPRIKKKYREYKKIEGEEEKFLLRIWHPSKKAKAWKVINQEIYETS